VAGLRKTPCGIPRDVTLVVREEDFHTRYLSHHAFRLLLSPSEYEESAR
jgi:hypothetical protein